ncbi:glycosyltransferase [Alkalihalobacterium chitinilyticum]|uniref:Glycosyltransferase n=1 Tax=Alkalihalobacterium chitinilyticum TaxID=2980103 RepID=A0ABT5VKR5_9BACI|nr:glycosyltransferase [Alkalihalobacterium chitinilyticum]MDE5415816.1 glycosyltransferase [Alkalihalobacterium chitinilyticum]
MLRLVKKGVIEGADWFLYRFLKTKHKEKMAKLFTQSQKEALKKLMNPGKKRSQLKKIEQVKYRLYNLGFTEKGLTQLKEFANQNEESFLKRLAAWELAVYYANLYSKDGAKTCLHYIEQATMNDKDKDSLRRAAILKAESYQLLGEVDKAKSVISERLASQAHVDLYLAMASLTNDLGEKEKWINKIFKQYQLPEVTFTDEQENTAYDRLYVSNDNEKNSSTSAGQTAKVSIIIPAYNSETTIGTSIESMMNQTWENLEILVIDDCSTDNTKAVIQDYAEQDARVRLLTTEKNSGAYVARNVALQVATGDYVTINDADDWSHPEKVKTQVEHLEANPNTIGNFSQQARATEDLKFYRRGKPGIYVFANMSSFMFRRKKVFEKLGFWDSVRFAGDSEYVKRIKKVFGEKSIVELPTAPLSFMRQSESSLTGNSAFGFPGYFMGARKEYAEAHEHFHSNNENLYYPFPQTPRPFAIPELMQPQREEKVDGRRHFDVIIASEFRLLGGTNMSNVEEIKAQKKLGLRTGLIQMSRYDLNSVTDVNPKVRELIDGNEVSMLVYGEKVSCDVLIVRHPPILQDWQKYIPEVNAKHVRVIVNQPPKREYSAEGTILYELGQCAKHMKDYFGQIGQWYPIGPSIRKTLHEHHAEELPSVSLADEDWVNIIDVNEWKRAESKNDHDTIRIGRHSRDQYVKWPDQKEELLQIYPQTKPYEIYVLGGAKAPKKVLGELPANWTVYEFGELHPKEFLDQVDIFVYYTHPQWVEAFGRVIFEAMAVGVPVIIPPSYEPLFGDAAIYAEPHEVLTKVDEIMSDREAYERQVETAQVYVENHFGYTKHASRLEECLHEENGQ